MNFRRIVNMSYESFNVRTNLNCQKSAGFSKSMWQELLLYHSEASVSWTQFSLKEKHTAQVDSSEWKGEEIRMYNLRINKNVVLKHLTFSKHDLEFFLVTGKMTNRWKSREMSYQIVTFVSRILSHLVLNQCSQTLRKVEEFIVLYF